MREDALLEWLRSRSPLLGDDAAKIRLAGDFACTVDTQEEGTHFRPGTGPAVLARRLLAVNLSDLAASGARPALAFLALAAPPNFGHRAFFTALRAAARRHGLVLAGGDLGRSDRVRAALFLVGRRPAGARWLSRGKGRAGDGLWVGGPLGLSAAGRLSLARPLGGATVHAARRAHLEPKPQLELGLWLGRQPRAAAIDVSDGLALDLHRLCRRSRVGARLDGEALPRPRGFAGLCSRLGVDPLELQLGGGEDYVLLFALPPSAEPPRRFGCTRVGVLTGGRRVLLRSGNASRPLPAAGWDHFGSASGAS
jgi:thiamine-monophosphate kinase